MRNVTKPQLYAYIHKQSSAHISLLPTESGGGVSFSVDEVISQSQACAVFYEKMISCWAPILHEYVGGSTRSAEVLARAGGIPTIHFWVDRLVRFLRLQKRYSFTVASAPSIYPVRTIDEFLQLVGSSSSWNQGLLCYFAKLFNLEVSPSEFISLNAPTENSPGFVNYMFDFRRKSLVNRVTRRLRSEWSKRFGGVPAMHMVNARVPMLDAGLYGVGLLNDLAPEIIYACPEPDFLKRRHSFGQLAELLRPHLVVLLHEFDASPSHIELAVDGISDYLCQTYPTSLLEGAKDNFSSWEQCLKRFKGMPLISSGVSFSTESAFAISAAKSLGMTVIGCQHGGYQGYTSWQTWALEGEYAFCDKFITWGWTHHEDHSASKHVQMIPLPAPWLWERQKRWAPHMSKLLDPERRAEFDLLFMPNKVNPFPPAPTGIQATTNDIFSYSEFVRNFVMEATTQKVSVLHKPHNQLTLDLFPLTHREIQDVSGEFYHLDEKLHKGLSLELLEMCRLVVWELPGTGFIECLTSGIPCMVIWTRSYNRENQWAEPIFKELEESSIVHRSFTTFFKEYATFKADPVTWMNDPSRIKSIKKFCDQYAWACDDWPAHWKRFIWNSHQLLANSFSE